MYKLITCTYATTATTTRTQLLYNLLHTIINLDAGRSEGAVVLERLEILGVG